MISEAAKRQRWMAYTLVLFSATVPPVQADGGSSQMGQVHMSPAQILFQASGPSDRASLRVGCSDGSYLETHTSDLSTLSFVPIREDGSLFGDVRCKYEFIVYPQIDQEAIDAAYRAGDERRLGELWEAVRKATRILSGSFDLKNGSIEQREK